MSNNNKQDQTCFDPAEVAAFFTTSQTMLEEGMKELHKISSEAMQDQEISRSLDQFQCAILNKISSEEQRLQHKLIDIRNCINNKLPKNKKESDDLKKEVDGLINEVKGLLEEMKNIQTKKCG